MTRKIIQYTPDQLGYKDRGKMKWQGLMLSDHAESLHKMAVNESNATVAAKPKQSITEISEILAEAYLAKKPIAIQANLLQNGSYIQDVPCMVSGTYDDKIFLMLKNKRIVHTTLEAIRHIEFIESDIWFQKSKTPH